MVARQSKILARYFSKLSPVTDLTVDGSQLCGVDLARKAGKPIGTVGPNPDMVLKYLDYGFTWIAINSDLGMMVNRAQEWLGKVKSGAKS